MLVEPDLPALKGLSGETYIGGSQEWYEDSWHKKAGCGPVAATNLIWSNTHPKGGIEQYQELMHEMYPCFTPGLQGINTSVLFTDSIMRYITKYDLKLNPVALDIPSRPRRRPKAGTVCDFIVTALQSSAPVAFLNLSNGTVRNLENWHWVTIIALDPDTMQANISDYGKVLEINISIWLKTSFLGGAFVYLKALT